MQLRPSKDNVIQTTKWLVPEYFELFKQLKLNNQSGIGFQNEVQRIRSSHGQYVLLYDDERKIGRATLYAINGKPETDDYLKELNESPCEEQQEAVNFIASLTKQELEDYSEHFQIPQTEKEWEEARKLFEELPEEDRKEAEFRGACFWASSFSGLFNILSVMILGTKLTALVPNALKGDDMAFLKAIQIDKQLLLSHPYFIEKKQQLQIDQNNNESSRKLLSRLVRVESKAMFISKIQYPALFLLFGILESFGWLEDLKHEEILDIFDSLGLDRYQNRIEDVNYLTHRLKNYRDWQKLNQVSMLSN